MEHIYNIEEEEEEYRPRVRRLEPETPYEFCDAFSKITGMKTGYFLSLSKGFSIETFMEIQSWAKASNNQKLTILKWYKDYRKSICLK